MTQYEKAKYAAEFLADDPDNGVHSAGVSIDDEGNYIVVCGVPRKLKTEREFQETGIKKIPERVSIGGETGDIKVRIEEKPMAKPQILMVRGNPDLIMTAESVNHFIRGMQDCQRRLIYGGTQVAPRQAQWVGTAGVACKLGGMFGFLSNHHVLNGDQFGSDAPVSQPHGGSSVIAYQKKWIDLKYGQGDNFVDCSFAVDKHWLDTDGKEIRCVPVQHMVGPIKKSHYPLSEIRIGQRVQKDGRTTGHTEGQVVQTGNTTYVGYGQGKTAKFRDQVVIRSSGSDFSAGGDSGSLITDMEGRPLGHLFAGGGQDTIANPIDFTVRELGIEFFEMRI